MSEPETFSEHLDVFQASHAVLKQNVQFWDLLMRQYAEGLLRNQQFLDLTGRAVESTFQFRQQIDQLVEAALATMQLPTRGDLDRALHKLNELEGQLRDLHEKVDRLLEQRQP
jgi:hypothetical protein